MGWLRSVGSIKWQVSFAEYRLFYRALLQKRPIILSILLTKATPYPLHRHEIRIEILSKIELFDQNQQPLDSVEPFQRILRAFFISQCPYKFSFSLDLTSASNRFRLFSRDFRLFRFFFAGSACFSKLTPPRNLPNWVKYYSKFNSFGEEFRRTKFIAVERVSTP